MKNAQGKGSGQAESGGLRKPVLMLRMNDSERERLDSLVKDAGWTGDLATFARELILSKRRRKGKAAKSGLRAMKLDEAMGTLMIAMKDAYPELSEESAIKVLKSINKISEVSKDLYSGQ